MEDYGVVKQSSNSKVEGYNKSSVLKHPKIHLTRYRDEKVRQRF